MQNLKFTTKQDKNGNKQQLLVNLEDKYLKYGYCLFYGGIELANKKELKNLTDIFITEGFEVRC